MSPGRRESLQAHSSRVRVLQLPGLKVDPNYCLVLNAARVRRHLRSLRPDIVEVGEPYSAPWVTRVAARGSAVPLVSFWHANYRSSAWSGGGYARSRLLFPALPPA